METLVSSDIDTVLDKLSRDDAFRAWILDDPSAALDSIGVHIDPQDLPAVRSLPSKEVIMAARLAIKAKLANSAGALPFFLSGEK